MISSPLRELTACCAREPAALPTRAPPNAPAVLEVRPEPMLLPSRPPARPPTTVPPVFPPSILIGRMEVILPRRTSCAWLASERETTSPVRVSWAQEGRFTMAVRLRSVMSLIRSAVLPYEKCQTIIQNQTLSSATEFAGFKQYNCAVQH